MRTINQKDILLCDFGEGVGSEQEKTRPALIVSNNLNNAYSDTIIVCPITSQNKKKEFPTHFTLDNIKYPFFTKDNNTVLCEQIRCVSRQRLGQYLGSIDDGDWHDVLEKMKINFSDIEVFS